MTDFLPPSRAAMPPATRRGINEEDVWQAADALLFQGRRPTIESVRLTIGRGSPNTITPFLDSWFKGLGHRLQDPRGYSRAPDVPEPIAAAAVHFWESAVATARAELSNERRELADAVRAVEQGHAELHLEAERMAAEQTALRDSLALAKEQLINATARGDRLVARNETMESEARELKGQLRELAELLDTERTARAADVRRANDARDAAREHYEASERRWLKETDAARTEAQAAKVEAEKVAKALVAARAELEQERVGHVERVAEIQALLAQAVAAKQSSQVEIQRLRKTQEILEDQIADVEQHGARELEKLRDQFTEAMRAFGSSLVAPTLRASVGLHRP